MADDARARATSLITRFPQAPYFTDGAGEPFHPIGHNDGIDWQGLAPLYRRRNPRAAADYLEAHARAGTRVIRLMLEYAQKHHRLVERPLPGQFWPAMVQFWDDLFQLCESLTLKILLTPFDTYWTWLKFPRHPYARILDHPSRMLIDPHARAAIKNRLTFAATRWGASPALFAWDLWNEIHPAQAEESHEPFYEFISDLSQHVRGVELAVHGRAHLQTVSLFGPEIGWRPHMDFAHSIFRHPSLDFANLHIYAEGTIDDPKNTVDAAIDFGRITRGSIAEITDNRPFFDSEHGPIHRFKDKRRSMPEDFDDEYFRHMQWAHLASGGAAGGMRWPNRNPHVLTQDMLQAQAALARFLPLIDWASFNRRPVDVETSAPIASFACASADQAILYLLRRDCLNARGMMDADAAPLALSLELPLATGRYTVTAFDTKRGRITASFPAQSKSGRVRITPPPIVHDVVLAVLSPRA